MNKWMGITTIATIIFISCAPTISLGETSQVVSSQEQQITWDKSYGGADKSYDTKLLQLREMIAPKFQTLEFKDSETGNTMTYNLFVPKNYDPKQVYPLVLFMADASTTGKGPMAPLKQGYGGIIWATDENQSKHPSFVLVPAFKGPENAVNDKWEVSAEVGTAVKLLNHVIASYSIDKNRLYTTGQSMGGMISFYLNANYPDLFAASLFVGSQWDISVLEPLAQQNFFYVVSAGDSKASGGMKEVGAMLEQKKVAFAATTFAANLSDAEQEKHIQDLIHQEKNINFVQFTAATVAPSAYMGGKGSEHMYSFDHAYLLEGIRDWLFKQTKVPGSQQTQKQLGKTLLDQGLLYFNGTGVTQDYAKAAQLLQEAWQQGNMKAPRYLGIMAEEGLGFTVDYAKALAHYQEAADAGDITAAARIGWLYERGLGVKNSESEALQWYLKAAPTPDEAAKNIHPRVLALSRLGVFYEEGLGVEQDVNQAKIWYQLAAQDNDLAAIEALKRLSP